MNQDNLNINFTNQEANQSVDNYNSSTNNNSKKPLIAIIVALIFIACAIVFAVFNRNVNKDSSEKSDNVKIKDEYFTTETLYYTEGLDGKADHYAYAIFEPNGKYTFQYVGEMTYGDSGLYVVSGQTLNLTAIYHITTGSYSMSSESSTVDFSNKKSIKIGNYTLNVVSSDKLKSLDKKGIISRYNDVKKQYINDINDYTNVSDSTNESTNIATKSNISVSDLKNAINSYSCPNYTSYASKNFNRMNALYLLSSLNGDTFNLAYDIFGYTYDVNSTEFTDFVLTNDKTKRELSRNDFDLSVCEWSDIIHNIFYTDETDSLITIKERVVLRYGGTPDNEYHYTYCHIPSQFPYNCSHENSSSWFYDGNGTFDMNTKVDDQQVFEWKFSKSSDGKIKFVSFQNI